MSARDQPNARPIGLTKPEIARIADGWPPILKVEEAAKLAREPVRTIYDWSSAGRLTRCARRRGKRLLINRDRFIEEIFNGREW